MYIYMETWEGKCEIFKYLFTQANLWMTAMTMTKIIISWLQVYRKCFEITKGILTNILLYFNGIEKIVCFWAVECSVNIVESSHLLSSHADFVYLVVTWPHIFAKVINWIISLLTLTSPNIDPSEADLISWPCITMN